MTSNVFYLLGNEPSLIRTCTRACHHLVGTLEGIILEIAHHTDETQEKVALSEESFIVSNGGAGSCQKGLSNLKPRGGAISKSEVMSGH